MTGKWSVVHLNKAVSAEFDELPIDIKAKFLHLAALIEEMGLPMVGEPYVKHIEGKLWERPKAVMGAVFIVHGRKSGLWFCGILSRKAPRRRRPSWHWQKSA